MDIDLTVNDVDGAARAELARAYWTRGPGRMAGPGAPLDGVLAAVGTALAGEQTVVRIDLSALDRREVAVVHRLVDDFARHTPNSGSLRAFADDLQRADTAANPGAVPLQNC